MLEIFITVVIFVVASVILYRIYDKRKRCKDNCNCGTSNCSSCSSSNCPYNKNLKEENNNDKSK